MTARPNIPAANTDGLNSQPGRGPDPGLRPVAPGPHPSAANSPISPDYTSRPRLTPDQIASLLASWKLTPEEHDRILHEKILPVELYPFLPPRKPESGSSGDRSVPGTAPHADQHQPQHRLQPQQQRRRPVAVLVLGQTGAGKTRLAPRLLRALEKGPPTSSLPLGGVGVDKGGTPARGTSQAAEGEESKTATTTTTTTTTPRPLHLIADTYKAHHPHYRDALAQIPSHASALASEDAARWLAGVVAHAAAGGSLPCCQTSTHRPDNYYGQYQPNILLEAACPTPLSPAQLATSLSRQGYRVRAAVLAVPYPLSRLGVLARYHRRLPEAGDTSRGMPARRLTPLHVHDKSFAGLRGWVAWVVDGGGLLGLDGKGSSSSSGGKEDKSDEQGLDGDGDDDGARERTVSSGSVERIVLLRRDMTVVYANQRVSPTTTSSSGSNSNPSDHDHIPSDDKNLEQRARPWQSSPAGALAALDGERRRRLTPFDRRAAEEDIAFLRSLGDAKVDREVEEIERMIAELGGGGEESQNKVGPAGGDEEIEMLDADEFIWGRVDDDEI
ncbi:hypothetical protein VTJ49DRAFT_3929 [Mycothermus thermophilus]|uniref:Zeta toxin domain-containing protein n=1 Tax=Humicola insolens TaxID=85995 RepID=A0ABR3V6J7_HUMIN